MLMDEAPAAPAEPAADMEMGAEAMWDEEAAKRPAQRGLMA